MFNFVFESREFLPVLVIYVCDLRSENTQFPFSNVIRINVCFDRHVAIHLCVVEDLVDESVRLCKGLHGWSDLV
jgi:hypothetical protein